MTSERRICPPWPSAITLRGAVDGSPPQVFTGRLHLPGVEAHAHVEARAGRGPAARRRQTAPPRPPRGTPRRSHRRASRTRCRRRRGTAVRSTLKWASTCSNMAADSSHCRVEPSMSVKRRVVVVLGRPWRAEVHPHDCSSETLEFDCGNLPDGRRRRSDQSRRHIVDAAGRLFVERGYVPTTIEDIARRGGRVGADRVLRVRDEGPDPLGGPRRSHLGRGPGPAGGRAGLGGVARLVRLAR